MLYRWPARSHLSVIPSDQTAETHSRPSCLPWRPSMGAQPCPARRRQALVNEQQRLPDLAALAPKKGGMWPPHRFPICRGWHGLSPNEPGPKCTLYGRSPQTSHQTAEVSLFLFPTLWPSPLPPVLMREKEWLQWESLSREPGRNVYDTSDKYLKGLDGKEKQNPVC